MGSIPTQGAFDYQWLDPEDRGFVRSQAEYIRALAHKTANGVIDIGLSLLDVKERLGHGHFGQWIEAEFGWSENTALRFMRTAKLSTENRQIGGFDIDVSALYLLAQRSTPPEIKAELLERAEAGERITHKVVRQALAPAADDPDDGNEDDDEIIDYVPAPRQPKRQAPKPPVEPGPDVPTFNELVGFLCRVPHERMTPEEACEISDPEMIAAIDRYFDQAMPWIEEWAAAWRMVRNAKRRGVGRAA